MADLLLRRLERNYATSPTPENLYHLYAHRIRSGLAQYPLTYQEIADAENGMGKWALPLIQDALVHYYPAITGMGPSAYGPYSDEENRENAIRNGVYHYINYISRWGNSSDSVRLLLAAAQYIQEHNTWADPQGRIHIERSTLAEKARSTAAWLQIAEQYGFTENTTVWDIVTSSPLLDEIEIFQNALAINRAYYQRKYGSYASDQSIPYYGSLAAEGSFSRQWRFSVPGYGDADFSVVGGLHQILHKLISAKYRGRVSGNRDPLPRERWPRSLIFCTTEEVAELLAGTALSRDRTAYNYLFIPPE